MLKRHPFHTFYTYKYANRTILHVKIRTKVINLTILKLIWASFLNSKSLPLLILVKRKAVIRAQNTLKYAIWCILTVKIRTLISFDKQKAKLQAQQALSLLKILNLQLK